VTVDAGEDSIAGDGRVRVFALANEVTISEELPCVVLDVAPAEARALAAALLRAADEAEGKPTERRGTWKIPPAGPEGTRRTAANLDGSRPENQEDDE
jgi:hypothetical protein